MRDLFATPLSLIIQESSRLINCTHSPVMFQSKGGDWFSATKGGMRACRAPIKLASHSDAWRDMDLGLNRFPPSTNETREPQETLHSQDLTNNQGTKSYATTVDKRNKTEVLSIFSGIRRIVKFAREK